MVKRFVTAIIIFLVNVSGALGADTDIRLNSLGFLPKAQKKATIVFKCSNFTVNRALDGQTVYTGKVTRIFDFGAMVEILPGKEGLVHISELADYRVGRVEDVVKVDDEVMIKVINIDNMGRVNLSRRAVFDDSSKPAGAREGDSSGTSRSSGRGRERFQPRPRNKPRYSDNKYQR